MKKLFILLLTAVIFCGCGTSGAASASDISNRVSEAPGGTNPAAGIPNASRDVFAMDTVMNVTCFGERCEEALDAAEAEILRLDALLSIGKEESEISKLNVEGSAVLSDDSRIMLEQALEVCETTNGCFDITVAPLMDLWGFPTQDFRVPDEEEIARTLKTVGSGLLRYDPETGALTLETGQGIDLGGIAKGYCSDRLVEIFEGYGLTSALVSLGGNVQAFHAKPDGSLWRCGIRDPFDPDNPNSLIGILSMKDCAVITSGAYERSFTGDDGKMYHHILDPRTGYPAESGLASVTVVSTSGILADCLSTACYVMGLEDAEAFWRKYGNENTFDLILVTDDGEVYITAPLAEDFTTDAPLHILYKDDVG